MGNLTAFKFDVKVQQDRKVLIIYDVTPSSELGVGGYGWGDSGVSDIDTLANAANGVATLAIEATLINKTYTKTFDLFTEGGPSETIDLIAYLNGLTPKPVNPYFYLAINLVTDELVLLTEPTYEDDTLRIIEDGVVKIVYTIDFDSTDGTTADSFEYIFMVRSGAENVLFLKASDFAGTYLNCHTYDTDDILENLVLEGLMFGAERNSYFAQTEVINKMLLAINVEGDEYVSN